MTRLCRCGRPVSARGLCKTHYNQALTRGELPPREPAQDRPAYWAAYYQRRAATDPEYVARRRATARAASARKRVRDA